MINLDEGIFKGWKLKTIKKTKAISNNIKYKFYDRL